MIKEGNEIENRLYQVLLECQRRGKLTKTKLYNALSKKSLGIDKKVIQKLMQWDPNPSSDKSKSRFSSGENHSAKNQQQKR